MAAPTARPIPTPRFVTFFLSSSWASSSSSRNSELACSATSLAVAPRPFVSVSRVGMSPPVDHFGEQDPGGERNADDEEGVRATVLLRLPPPAELRAGRGDRAVIGLLILRRPSLRTGDDQARL